MPAPLFTYERSSRDTKSFGQAAECFDRLIKNAEDKKPWLGWVRLPNDKDQVKQVKTWLKKVKKNQTTLCVLGIGGSCLGAKAIYDWVKPGKSVLFLDNVDGFAFESALAGLDLKKTHFLAISKSGETAETLFQLAHVFDLLKAKKLKFKDHVSVVTEDKLSTLKKVAVEFALPSMSMPEDVGGRFSVFSTVGLAPLVWAGVKIEDLLKGASWALGQKAAVTSMTETYLASFERGEWISVFWMYNDRLRTFGLWIEQLWAESLAKAKNRNGASAPRASTPLTCVGATDQHSLLQQFSEGARDKHFMFIRCAESEKSRVIKKPASETLFFTKNRSVGGLLKIEAAAAQKVMDAAGHFTGLITVNRHDALTIGALLFLFELVVGVMGEAMDINAFDQPGVEAIKKVTWGTLGDSRYKDLALLNL